MEGLLQKEIKLRLPLSLTLDAPQNILLNVQQILA